MLAPDHQPSWTKVKSMDCCTLYISRSVDLSSPLTLHTSAVLSSWDFLRSVFKSGHAAKVVQALGHMGQAQMSEYALESYRLVGWLVG